MPPSSGVSAWAGGARPESNGRTIGRASKVQNLVAVPVGLWLANEIMPLSPDTSTLRHSGSRKGVHADPEAPIPEQFREEAARTYHPSATSACRHLGCAISSSILRMVPVGRL
jgi:hypothetical protein